MWTSSRELLTPAEELPTPQLRPHPPYTQTLHPDPGGKGQSQPDQPAVTGAEELLGMLEHSLCRATSGRGHKAP